MNPILEGENGSVPEGIELNVKKVSKQELERLKNECCYSGIGNNLRKIKILKMLDLTVIRATRNQYIEHKMESKFRF